MEKKEEIIKNEDNGPPPIWQLTPKLPALQTSTPPSWTQGASLEGESFPIHSDEYPCSQVQFLFSLALVYAKIH